MAFHLLMKRCDECGRINAWRKPNRTILISRIIHLLLCPYCHPETLAHCCGACHLPFAAVPNRWGNPEPHAYGLDFTCYTRSLRNHVLPRNNATV